MTHQVVEKINFLLEYDLQTITIILSFLFGGLIAIPNALRPASLTTVPLPPLRTTALSILGNCFHSLIIASLIITLHKLINKSSPYQRFKAKFNSDFYYKFNQTPYTLYPNTHKTILTYFLGCIPFAPTLLSSIISVTLGVDSERVIYLNLLAVLTSNMVITMYYINDLSRLISLILFATAIIVVITIISLPFFRLEKKVK